MTILLPQLESILTQLTSLTSTVADSAASQEKVADAQKVTAAKLDTVTGRLEKTLADVTASLQHTQAEVASLKTQVIPGIVDRLASVQTATIINQLAQDVWARKWNVLACLRRARSSGGAAGGDRRSHP